VRASAKYTVNGLDKAFVQGIAAKAYNDFVAQLRGAGYTVLTYNDIKDRDYVRSASRAAADGKWGVPTESSREGNNTFIVAAPSDAQQFEVGMMGVFWEFISRGKPKFEDATIMIPTYTIVAPNLQGEKAASYATISANVKASADMMLLNAYAPWMGKPKVRMGGGNHPGVLRNKAITISDNVGALSAVDTTSEAGNAVSGILGMLGGGGSIKSKTMEYTLNVDRIAYSAGALKGIAEFNAEVAKAAASAPQP